LVGLVPGFGEPADGLNALIYSARGDYLNAGLSAGSMIPVAGWLSTGGKFLKKALKYSDEAASLSKKTPIPKGTANPLVKEAVEKGKEAHKIYDPGPGFEKEFPLPSKKRPDGINFETNEIKELKPNNPNAIKKGQKQLNNYVKEATEQYGGTWKGILETYTYNNGIFKFLK